MLLYTDEVVRHNGEQAVGGKVIKRDGESKLRTVVTANDVPHGRISFSEAALELVASIALT